MKKLNRSQKGFMLVGVAIASVVFLILAFAIVRYGMIDAESVTRSKVSANLQVALDAGLERGINVLSGSWSPCSVTAGFMSLSATAYSEIPRVKYWVMILEGAKNVSYPARTLDDSSAWKLTNTGDIYYDRTILVRAADTVTGITATAQGNIHRNDRVSLPVVGGITTSGIADLDQMDFRSYNSCTGVAPGGCSGTVQGSPAQGGHGSCLPLVSNTTPVVIPTVVVPAVASPMPGNTLVTQDWNGNGSAATVGAGTYRCANFNMGGSDNLYINTCAGPVYIYVTGNMQSQGNCVIQSGCNPVDPGHPLGGAPAKATIYVSGGTVDLAGTGSFEVLLFAPVAVVTITGGGNGSFYGAIVSKTFDGGSSSLFDMNFDACLLARAAADNYLKPPIVTNSWKILP
jgi:hypothetical protein